MEAAENALRAVAAAGKTKIVAMSATPQSIRERFGELCYDVPFDRSDLRHLETHNEIPYYEDVAIAHSRQRVAVDFDLGTLPPEPNLIIFDDFVTTGSTLNAMYRLLEPLGKNLFFVVGINNNL